MNRYVCIHGHFYQPPRENPWLEEVEVQDSAYPYHDWNSRITAECYAPNTVSRILDPDRNIIDIVNNYAKISFNFGPTLLSWMQRHAPRVYQAVLDADKEGVRRFSGHGTALAQAYNHMIMPLASARDKRTQLVWGIRDFEYRYGRKPEGMWLPEAAVDLETLDIMAELGIRFTILAPGQAKRVRPRGGEEWHDVNGAKIDPRTAYFCSLPSGRTINLFFYDGPISHDIAFGGILSDGNTFSARLMSVLGPDNGAGQLAHVSTDGETYGHHHRFGEMALAFCLYQIESRDDVSLTVYGEFLDRHPPETEVEIHENSSWSCFHGVERWRADCGCNSGARRGWNQKWRAPLRGALDWLRDNVALIYEEQARQLLKDPWAARNDYIEIILERTDGAADAFLARHRLRDLSLDERVKVLKLLEMQRQAMLMYTSCGWFFDELSGIETVQILCYAARAVQLAREVGGVELEETFLAVLERAPSNLPEYRNGRVVYEICVKPAVLDVLRVGMHYAVSSLFEEYPGAADIYSYRATSRAYTLDTLGKQRLAAGIVHIKSSITEEEGVVSFAVLHFGDHNLLGAAGISGGDDDFAAMYAELKSVFLQGNLPEVVRLMEQHFKQGSFSLWHLFRDEQRKIVKQIFDASLKEVDGEFSRIFENNLAILQASEKLKTPLPKPFDSVAAYMLNKELLDALSQEYVNTQKLKKVLEELRRFALPLDQTTTAFVIGSRITRLMERLCEAPQDVALIEQAVNVLSVIENLQLDLNLWRAQNIYFSVGKQELPAARSKLESGDLQARLWLANFEALGDYLKVRIA